MTDIVNIIAEHESLTDFFEEKAIYKWLKDEKSFAKFASKSDEEGLTRCEQQKNFIVRLLDDAVEKLCKLCSTKSLEVRGMDNCDDEEEGKHEMIFADELPCLIASCVRFRFILRETF